PVGRPRPFPARRSSALRIEAAAHVRAVCRECGAAIEPGQPRFGGEEGPEGARRPRWRHLACAAQAMPDALLRALEFGGWRSVAKDRKSRRLNSSHVKIS